MSIYQSIISLQEALLAGTATATGVVRGFLDRIRASEELNIFIEVYEEEALNQAAALDQSIAKGNTELRVLDGCVVSIKDVLCYKGHRVTAASNILGDYTAPYTATAIQKLIDAGAIIIGRTNCDEFAMGSTTEHSRYGATKNGRDPQRVPGGSSGGAAVSVEQDTCMIGIGSDTGGSVRQPAAFCGIYGMKPSYGRISRYGLIAYGSSFDQIGIVSKDISTLSSALSVMCGQDPLDATSAPLPPPANYEKESSSKKIAYISEVLEHPSLNSDIKSGVMKSIEDLRSQGHICEPVSLDLLDYLVPAYYVLTTAEASSNLGRYDGIKYGYRTSDFKDLTDLYERTRSEGFGMEVKRRIMMGTFVLSVGYYDAYFTKAQQVRTLIIDQVKKIFEDYDFIITPTTTDVAFKTGEMISDPIAMYMSDVTTVLANLTGIPGISIPKEELQSGLPYGIQIMSDKYEEEELLSFSRSL